MLFGLLPGPVRVRQDGADQLAQGIVVIAGHLAGGIGHTARFAECRMPERGGLRIGRAVADGARDFHA